MVNATWTALRSLLLYNYAVIGHFTCQTVYNYVTAGQVGCRIVTKPFFSGRVGSGHETNSTLSQGTQTLDKKLGGACMRTRLVPHSYQLKVCEQSLEVTIKHLYLHTDSRVIVTLIAKLLARLLNSYTLVTLLPPATGDNTPKEVPLLESCLQS